MSCVRDVRGVPGAEVLSPLSLGFRLPPRLTKHLPHIHQQSHSSVHQARGPLAHQQVMPCGCAGCLIMKDTKTSHTLSASVKAHMYPTLDQKCISYISYTGSTLTAARRASDPSLLPSRAPSTLTAQLRYVRQLESRDVKFPR